MTEKDFEKLFQKQYYPLSKFLYLYTDNSNLIQDILQNTFLCIWERRDRLTDENLKSYLFNTAKNKLLNAIRSQQRQNLFYQKYLLEELSEQTADDIVDIDLFLQQIEIAVSNLPARTQIIYQLSRKEKLTNKAIAQQESISLKAVEAHITKALRLIYNHLNLHFKKNNDT